MDRTARAAARLTSLYEEHGADAFRYALHITGRREDAEDVVQHVFLQAYAMLEAGRELVNPRAWLIKATKHRSLNLLRDRRDMPAAEIEPPSPFAPDEGEAEALADVRATLWSLPESQHHAFVLRHWSGLSQDEIADVLATTPGAVESLLVRARAALVAEREGGDPECAGVRARLASVLAPTPDQAAHVAGCRRCRTAQTRLRRAAEFATAFALVPSPHVLHSLAAAIPGFGASGAVAGASATGIAAGAGGGGAAASTVSAATKVGLLTKVAVAATTAAVAVTAAHPLRSAVSHAIFPNPPAPSAAAPRASSHAAPSATAVTGRVAETAPGATRPGRPPATDGRGRPTPGGGGEPTTHPAGPPADAGGGNGKSGTAATNGNGTGNGQSGGTHGKSVSAPGRTKAAGVPAAGKGKANGSGTGQGVNPPDGGTPGPPARTETNPGGGPTPTPTTGVGAANGKGSGSTNAGGAGGGTGKGNGKA